MNSSKGFDRLAPFYDMLAGVVFGSNLKIAQKYFLHKIPDGSRILILGGGTGWILTVMLRNKINCQVCYIDASAEMISIARKRDIGKNAVNFIAGTESDIPAETEFDFVITNFYLDMFTDSSVNRTVCRLMPLIAAQGHWLVTDFTTAKTWWQKMLLKSMYSFFGYTCGIEARNLPAWEVIMGKHLQQRETKDFFYRFIKSVVYTT